MFRSFDAAYPPLTPPPGCSAVLGYIGGQTPHVWTVAEWRRFGHLQQAPIWVYGQGWDPATAGRTAASRTAELGWTPNAPTRRFIVLDMEASVNSGWVAAFADAVRSAGYDIVVYGSAAFVHGNPVESGYWVALWDGRTDVPAGAVAHQYQANVAFGGTEVDYSMWEQAFLDRFGWGPRR